MSSNWTYVLFLDENGVLYGAGMGDPLGLPGIGSVDKPVLIAENVLDIEAGQSSYYISDDHALMMLNNIPSPALVQTDVSGVSSPPGRLFYIQNGNLHAGGRNTNGALGTGEDVASDVSESIASHVTKVKSIGSNTFFLKGNGELWGMGANQYGILNTGGFAPRFAPVLICQEVKQFDSNGLTLYVLKQDGSQP